MSDAIVFIVVQSQGEDYGRLACETRIRPDQSELEGARSG